MAELSVSEQWQTVTSHSHDWVFPDSKFWAAHSHWKSLNNATHSGEGDSIEIDRRQAAVSDAFYAMWLTPARSAFAVAAKLKSCDFKETALPEPAGTTTQMLEWDLGRLIMREFAPIPTQRRQTDGN